MDFTGGSANPGTEAVSWRESSRTGHGTEPLTARAGPSLPGYSEIFPSGLTHRTQSLNLKPGREQAERETETPWMESSDRHCTGPNTCTFFRAHVTPLGESGEESAQQLQPLLAAAYLGSHTWSQEKRGAKMLNEITRAARRQQRHARHRMSVRCANSPWVTPGTGQLSPGQG